jgi:hypothetical protein
LFFLPSRFVCAAKKVTSSDNLTTAAGKNKTEFFFIFLVFFRKRRKINKKEKMYVQHYIMQPHSSSFLFFRTILPAGALHQEQHDFSNSLEERLYSLPRERHAATVGAGIINTQIDLKKQKQKKEDAPWVFAFVYLREYRFSFVVGVVVVVFSEWFNDESGTRFH